MFDSSTYRGWHRIWVGVLVATFFAGFGVGATLVAWILS